MSGENSPEYNNYKSLSISEIGEKLKEEVRQNKLHDMTIAAKKAQATKVDPPDNQQTNQVSIFFHLC